MTFRFSILFLASTATLNATDDVTFNRDVRPILADKCFHCHGPDAAERQADLRLDQEESAKADRDGYSVVKPGDVEHSELAVRILSEDLDLQMPPSDSGRSLTDAEKQTLLKWIESGAAWEGHWSFVSPQRPELPSVHHAAWPRNAIDRFVRRRLEEAGLSPSPEAEREIWIRRVSFDLTGLPPSLAEVDAFLADDSVTAHETVVDRLLESPRYGEHQAAAWLDAARYADTDGYQNDGPRTMHRYRDWVIDAFNANMPFDQFTIEQIAGDLLPNATDEQKIASGYNRLLMTTREGGAQAKEYLAKYSADRVRNASTVWMGATMGCCECHDHKFDPYSIKDFYQFAAFFADVQDVPVGVQPSVKMPSREQTEQLAALDAKLAGFKKTLDSQTPELDAAMHTWATELQAKLKPLYAIDRYEYNFRLLQDNAQSDPIPAALGALAGFCAVAIYWQKIALIAAG